MGLQTTFWIRPDSTTNFNLVENILKLKLPFLYDFSFTCFLRLHRYASKEIRLDWALRPWHQIPRHNIVDIFAKAARRSAMIQIRSKKLINESSKWKRIHKNALHRLECLHGPENIT